MKEIEGKSTKIVYEWVKTDVINLKEFEHWVEHVKQTARDEGANQLYESVNHPCDVK